MIPKLILAGAICLISCATYAETIHGRVVGITDGDTVTVLDSSNTQYKIRLMGIDAPEKKQAFGQKSKEYLSSLVYDKEVTIEYRKRDRYRRPVGKITVDSTDACLEQVKAGMAWHYKKYAKEQSSDDRLIYAKAEEEARSGRKGLWEDADPTPPWDWRNAKRVKKAKGAGQ